MSEVKVEATTRVRITVDITLPTTWDKTCTIEMIEREAARDAVDFLRRCLGYADAPGAVCPVRDYERERISIAGHPEVASVIVRKRP